jgi:hypothetical protein
MPEMAPKINPMLQYRLLHKFFMYVNRLIATPNLTKSVINFIKFYIKFLVCYPIFWAAFDKMLDVVSEWLLSNFYQGGKDGRLKSFGKMVSGCTIHTTNYLMI